MGEQRAGPDTVADRAVIIPMKKRKHTERVTPWRERIHANDANVIGDASSAWMKSAPLSWPEAMPVEDRAADVWEALVMVADAAGGHWPATARAAAVVLTSEKPHASLGVQLLRDLLFVFGPNDKMRGHHRCVDGTVGVTVAAVPC
jgi:hypothetical protein